MFLEKFINMLCHYLFLSARAPKKYNILIQEPNFALPEEDMKEFDQRSYDATIRVAAVTSHTL